MALSSKRDVAQRICDTSQLKGEFTLRSGATSDTYFDKYLFESDPILLRAIAEHLAQLVPDDTQVLAGLDLGGVPLVTALSQVTSLPAAFLRKTPKTYGTCKYAEGARLTGRNVTLVEDVVSSGGAIIDTLTMLRNDGIEPKVALCVIDRETGGKENLAAEGIELRPMFTMADIRRGKFGARVSSRDP